MRKEGKELHKTLSHVGIDDSDNIRTQKCTNFTHMDYYETS